MGKKATSLLIQSGIIITTILCAVFAVLGWISSFMPPHEFWTGTLISVVMFPLLIVNFIFLIYWGFKLKIWALFPLMAIGVNINLLTATFQFRFEDKKEYPSTIKIATYNIHGQGQPDFNFTLKSIADFLIDEKVDIVCFQEYHETDKYPIDSMAKHFTTMPYHILPKGQSAPMTLVIFSKFPIKADSLLQFEDTGNGAMWADIDINGETVRIFNNHFQTTSINQSKRQIAQIKSGGVADDEGKEAFNVLMSRLYKNSCQRAEQVNAVRSIMDTTKGEMIVCGDFNDSPNTYTYRKMSKGLKDGFKTSGKGFAYTYKPMFHLFRLDYIFYSDNFNGVRYDSPSLEWSDHNPVLLELAFRN